MYGTRHARDRRVAPSAAAWRRALRAVFDWWCNLDRRRPAAAPGRRQCGGRLDEAYVVAAMARQLKEIRRLPEVAA